MLTKLFRLLIISLLLICAGCANADNLQKSDETSLGYTKTYVLGQYYKDVVNLFRNADFNDIYVNRLEGEEYQNYRNGEVVNVKIGDLEDFKEDTLVSHDDKIVISYVANEQNVNLLTTAADTKTIKDFKLFKSSDYLIFNDNNDLGWDETWTITIEAEPNNIDWDDFDYEYDDEILDIKAKSLRYDNQKSYIAFDLKSKIAGLTKINVCAYLEDGQKCQDFSVNCLDEIEGRRVYIIPKNNEYHYSEECPKEDYIMTTYHFVSSKDIKACDLCTK